MDDRPYWWILDGHTPVQANSSKEWAEWFGTADRHVGYTEIGEGVEVSTVFLALDHNFYRDGAPILFETMVFIPKEFTVEIAGQTFEFHRDELPDFTRRYATWDEAETGHKLTVSLVKEMIEASTLAVMKDLDKPES
jgi:hypothetical protein